ncbi:hypothetical protein [Sphaerisporangium sp. NPDC051011]|uniref:hypothetical protein n=1 Tax=Sphaerisporangium sp. NPDC051011 TaxID=3155792 RepID=UPI0033F759FD
MTRSLEAEAIDDALDLFALLMASRLISPARRKSSGERLAMLPKLEKASGLLSRAGRVLVEQLDLVAEAGADLDVAAAVDGRHRGGRGEQGAGRGRAGTG